MLNSPTKVVSHFATFRNCHSCVLESTLPSYGINFCGEIMLSIKKALLTAAFTTCCSGVATLAFFSPISLAQANNAPANNTPTQEQPAQQETIGQTIGRGIDDIVSSFKQFSDDLDQNIGTISEELKRNWGDIKQGLFNAQNELQAAINAQTDQGYIPEDPNEAGRSSDPYGYIKSLQETKLPEFDANRTLSEVVNTYPHCAPRTKFWEYFTTPDKEQYVTFSCRLPNATGQIQELRNRTGVQISVTLNNIGNNIRDFFSSSDENTLNADQLLEAKEQSLQVSSMEMVSLFQIQQEQQQTITSPQRLYFYVHFADGTVGEIPLDWQQFSMFYGNQDLLEPQIKGNMKALKFIDKLTDAYLGRNHH